MQINSYNLIIFLAAAVSAAVGVLCVFIKCRPTKKTLVVLAVGAASVMVAYVVSSFIDVGLRKDMRLAEMNLFDLSTGKQYYITMIIFWCVFSLAIHNIGFSAAKCCDIVCPAVISFSIISRIACYMGGCCSGKQFGSFSFPSRELEIIIGLILLEVSVFHSKGSASRYIICYSIFRLCFDFFRVPGGQMTLWILSANQLMAVVVIVFYVIMGKSVVKKENEVNKL